jgi:hypothetical protein
VNGEWQLDTECLRENLGTISDVDRPVVIYLSSNHFADEGKELCAELARDPVNLMWNSKGPMAADAYFDSSVIPWTLEDRHAPVNEMRRRAFVAALAAIRALPEASRDRIVAISILGEVHQGFSSFFAGPGFDRSPADGTDYAPIAVAGFRTWLAQSYADIAALNRELGADFPSFDAVNPPSRDINSEQLSSFFEHLDVHAAGRVAVNGWVHDRRGRELSVEVHLDGQPRGVAESGLSRTDVTEALPQVRDPNVGFRLNLDFSGIEPGIHVLEVTVRDDAGARWRLARQPLVVADRTQARPPAVESSDSGLRPLASDADLAGALDGPKPWTALFYNPLARLWLAYRNQVVRNYIEEFARIAVDAGIAREKLFSHQVTPALVGSWNPDLLAADASKQPSGFFNPGTTLYGGAAFGRGFLDMKSALGWESYAVNEMHPMVELRGEDYLAMFDMHRLNGAAFVAPYFIYIGPEQLRGPGNEHERFRIAPDNPRHGSDAYWRAIREVMRR